MEQKNNGGAAFPDPGRAQSAKQRETLTDTGMTLRDYFAAQACAAIAGSLMNRETWHGWSHGEIAKEGYDIADAMLTERAK